MLIIACGILQFPPTTGVSLGRKWLPFRICLPKLHS